MNIILPDDFDVNIYIKLNTDLKNMSELEAKIHYTTFGCKENRIYKYLSVLPEDFDINVYIELNPDLKHMSKLEAYLHYTTFGYKENRIYKYLSVLPEDFEPSIYIELNSDLKNMTETDAKIHYTTFGCKENRIYKYLSILPQDFNPSVYLELNTDLDYMTETDAKIHYTTIGCIENRIYKYLSILPKDYDPNIYIELNKMNNPDSKVNYTTNCSKEDRTCKYIYVLPEDFDPSVYIKLNSDLSTMTEIEAKIHYETIGCKENRIYKYISALPEDFDPRVYIELNPDLGVMTETESKIHYIIIGCKENRIYKYISALPEDFISSVYIELNPDLGVMTETKAKIHYVTIGCKENRIYKYISALPEDFDPSVYIELNPDLGVMTETKAKIHYVTIGCKENRIYKYISALPEDFDSSVYIELNPDLGVMTETKSKIHYVTIGCKENRIYKYISALPEDFDPSVYIELNSDLGVMTETEAKIHFIKYGINENRLYKYILPENFNSQKIIELNKELCIEEINIIKFSEKNKLNYNNLFTIIYNDCINIYDYEINIEKIKFCKKLLKYIDCIIFTEETDIFMLHSKFIPNNFNYTNISKYIKKNLKYIELNNIYENFKIKYSAIYFPQYHSIPENDKFWSKDFTEWTLLKPYSDKIVGLNNKTINIMKPHEDIGYYELTINTFNNQVNISNNYKIDIFMIYHYWFETNTKVMYKPLEFLKVTPKIFYLCWANEPWTKVWDGNNDNILLNQTYDNLEGMIEYLYEFFILDNYYKDDEGNIIYFIYNYMHLGENNFNRLKIIWEDFLKKRNKTIKFIFSSSFFYTNNNDFFEKNIYFFEPLENNINRFLTNNPVTDKSFNYYYVDYNNVIKYYENINIELLNNKIQGVCLNWNNSVRRKNNKFLFLDNFNQTNLKTLLYTQIVNIIINNKFYSQKLPNFLIINAWNEWNEQAILEPNNITGYDNLNTLKNVYNNLSNTIFYKKYTLINTYNIPISTQQLKCLEYLCNVNNFDIICPVIYNSNNNVEYYGGETIDNNVYLYTKNSKLTDFITIETNVYYKYLYLIKTSKINENINELKIGVTPKVYIIQNNISNTDFIGKTLLHSCYDSLHLKNILNNPNNNLYFSEKKNILFIDMEFNDLNGGSIYSINILKLLSTNYNIYFHPNTNRRHKDNKFYDLLMDYGIKIILFNDIMNLNELNTFYFEYIFISRIDNSYYIDRLKKFYNSTYILLTHDLIHTRNSDIKKDYELNIYNKFDRCIMISKNEINYLNNNGIDLDKIIYIPFLYESKKSIYNLYSNKDIYFIGSEHPPNIEGINIFLKYFQKILEIEPDIKLHIIGKCSKHFNNIKSVICHDYIENIENILENIRLMIVPLINGAGMKCKIIEAINYGIPVITTSKGIEGIDVINNENIFIMDFNDNYHLDFIKIYNNLTKLSEISINSKKLFDNNYSLQNGNKYIIPRLFEKYNNIQIINTFKLKIILQIYDANEKLIQQTIDILTNLPLNIDVYIINNGIIKYNFKNNNNKNIIIHYLKGDNTFKEWSGFNVYLNTYKNDIDNNSLYLFVNETIYKNYPINITNCYNIENLIKIYNNKLICGHIDSFNESFQVLNNTMDKWIRGNFFILNYDTLVKLNFNLIFYNYNNLNETNLQIFLSKNIIDRLFNWLNNNKRYNNINKINKIKCIINEYLLSYYLNESSPLIDINSINKLDSFNSYSINLNTDFTFYHIEKCGGMFLKNKLYNSFLLNNYTNNQILKDNNIKNKTINYSEIKIILIHCKNEIKYSKTKFKLTIIRDPVKRFISHYYYFIYHDTKKNLDELTDYELTNLLDFYGSYMCNVLGCLTQNKANINLIKKVVSEFDFIGTLENINNDYLKLQKLILRKLNIKLLNIEDDKDYKNENNYNCNVSEKTLDKIKSQCKDDYILYDYVKNLNNDYFFNKFNL
jgi:hypothetical protein